MSLRILWSMGIPFHSTRASRAHERHPARGPSKGRCRDRRRAWRAAASLIRDRETETTKTSPLPASPETPDRRTGHRSRLSCPRPAAVQTCRRHQSDFAARGHHRGTKSRDAPERTETTCDERAMIPYVSQRSNRPEKSPRVLSIRLGVRGSEIGNSFPARHPCFGPLNLHNKFLNFATRY